MITLKLWRLLEQIDPHTTLYRHLRMAHHRYALWSDYTAYDMIMQVMFLMLASIFFMVTPILTVTFFGAYWAIYIAGAIREEHLTDRFDLLALLPQGASAVYHILAVIHLRHSRMYPLMLDGIRVTGLIGGLMSLVITSGWIVALLSNSGNLTHREVNEITILLLTILAITGYSLTDQVQSVVLSCLLGMVAAMTTQTILQARLLSGVTFIGTQMMTYAVLLISLTVVPDFLPNNVPRFFILFAVTGGAVLLGRELLIFRLWRRVQYE